MDVKVAFFALKLLQLLLYLVQYTYIVFVKAVDVVTTTTVVITTVVVVVNADVVIVFACLLLLLLLI